MKKIKITNEILSHENFEKIQTILSENGINTFVMPSNEGVTNRMVQEEDNIILFTQGDNILLENRNGFFNAHFLSDVNLFRFNGEFNVTERISLRNPSTEVVEDFMGEFSECILGEVFFQNTMILNIELSGGSDIQKIVRNAILNRHFELHPELTSGLSDVEVFDFKKSLDLDEICENLLEEVEVL